MTCNERLEALLNRAGQTISDLPKAGEFTYAHLVNNPYTVLVVEKAIHDYERFGYAEYNSKSTDDYRMAIDYILHLTDIIDRLEWALENVCGERDYLRRVICGLCSNFHEDGADACETCMIGEGVPEYRSVDDADI